MKTNLFDLSLVGIGLTITSIGLCRAFPIKVDSSFWVRNSPQAIVLVGVIIAAGLIGGSKFLQTGIDSSMSMGSNFLVTILLLIPLIGFSMPLAKHFEPQVSTALQTSWGYPCAILTATGMPSGNALAAMVKNLWDNHKELRPLLAYFQIIIALVSYSIFNVRVLGLGMDIAFRIYMISFGTVFFLAPCFWLGGQIYIKYFCKT